MVPANNPRQGKARCTICSQIAPCDRYGMCSSCALQLARALVACRIERQRRPVILARISTYKRNEVQS